MGKCNFDSLHQNYLFVQFLHLTSLGQGDSSITVPGSQIYTCTPNPSVKWSISWLIQCLRTLRLQDFSLSPSMSHMIICLCSRLPLKNFPNSPLNIRNLGNPQL